MMKDEEIIRTYGNMVYAIAMNYVRDRYDADDVYSETFLRFFRKSRSFESEEHRKAYIIRVAINCAKDFASEKTRHGMPQPIAEMDFPVEMENKDEQYALQAAMEQLQPEERDLVYLFYYQGMKSAEIAETLKTSDNAVRSKLKRIREKLRALLTF